MRLEEFSYHLPEGLIAQSPLPARSASRLLVASRRAAAAAIHTTFDNLPEFLRPGDLVVVNRTRVVPARLLARRDDGLETEVLFLRALPERRFVAWARPLRKLAVRHDVLAIEVLDPRELELPDVGVLALADAETGIVHEIQTSDRRLRERYAAAAAAQRHAVAAAIRESGASHLRLRTDSDWLLDIVKFVAAARHARTRGTTR